MIKIEAKVACRHGYKYCYAIFNAQSVLTLSKKHDPPSSFLIGNVEQGDRVKLSKMKKLKKDPAGQLSPL